jgi:hypothetical protein
MLLKKIIIYSLSVFSAGLILWKYSLFLKEYKGHSRRTDLNDPASDRKENTDGADSDAKKERIAETADSSDSRIVADALKIMYNYTWEIADKRVFQDERAEFASLDSIRGWLSAPFKENRVTKYFLLTEVGFEEALGCHACAPEIGAAIIIRKNGRTVLERYEKVIDTGHVMGAWGFLSKWHFVKMGPERMGVVFDHWGGNQGYFGGSYEILTNLDNHRFGFAADLQGGIDDTGADGKQCFRTSMDILTGKVDKGYYHIQLLYFPLGSLRKTYKTEFYRFNGKEFFVYKTQYVKVRPEKILALQQKHRKSLM